MVLQGMTKRLADIDYFIVETSTLSPFKEAAEFDQNLPVHSCPITTSRSMTSWRCNAVRSMERSALLMLRSSKKPARYARIRAGVVISSGSVEPRARAPRWPYLFFLYLFYFKYSVGARPGRARSQVRQRHLGQFSGATASFLIADEQSDLGIRPLWHGHQGHLLNA